MRTFIIGDTHFHHKNIIDYCKRPFLDVEDMHAKLIENWNNTVDEGDLVIHVGDFSLSTKKEEIKKIFDQLNGRIWLILGNHDALSVADYYDIGFEFVSDKTIIYKDYFIISHRPVFMVDGMPYMNIYGHVHDNPLYPDSTENSWCVAVERTKYAPALFKVEDFKFEHKTFDNSQKVRLERMPNGRHFQGLFRGTEITIIVRGGRIFVEGVSKYGGIFRQEFGTLAVGFEEVKAEVRKALTNPSNSFAIKLFSRQVSELMTI